MAENVLKIPGELDLDKKRAVVEQRRCILLAVIGSTPDTNPTMNTILSNGLLDVVKSWLDDILNGAIGASAPLVVGSLYIGSRHIGNRGPFFASHGFLTCLFCCWSFPGGVDLLLVLLSSIIELPVTKSIVLDSGMGKAVRDIEKHKICAGTPNEPAIKSRVQEVKDAWNASVKVNKVFMQYDTVREQCRQHSPHMLLSSFAISLQDAKKKKRPLESSSDNSPTKRSKVDDQGKKSSSFAKLLMKVSSTDEKTPPGAKSADTSSDNSTASSIGQAVVPKKAVPKKPAKRVKWSDHFGGNLVVSRVIKADAVESLDSSGEQPNISWSDRKKRDRLREKELLAQAKYVD